MRNRTRRSRLATGLAALPLLLACASPSAAPPVSAAPGEAGPALGDIHDCLLASRRPVSDGLASGMVVPARYNACMRAKGWRTGAAAAGRAG